MAPPEYKILHIQKVAGIAGSENHLLTLLPKLREYGYQPTMLVLADKEDRPDPFIEQMRSIGIRTDILLMRDDADPLLILPLVGYLRRNCFDLIHTHLFHADIYGTLTAGLVGIKHRISTQHGFSPWREQRLYGLLDRIAASQQQQIITVSKEIGKWLVEVEKLPAEKMRTIHHGIDLEQLYSKTQVSQELVNVGRPVIGTISRLLDWKGLDFLLSAFERCLEKYPQASLVIAGDGPERFFLEQQAHALGIAEKVYFLGHLPHSRIGSLIQTFDIFAFPSFGEGFGIVLLEAMAWGKPIVASNAMSIPEIVIHGKTGLLVAPRDSDALAQGLLKLIESPSLCQQFGSAGRQRLEQEFTVDIMVQKTIAVYDEVLGISRVT